MTQTVCTIQVPAAHLKAGDIVVTSGRARYLQEKNGHLCGYDRWPYVTYAEDGAIAGRGEMNVRPDATVTTVAVHVDGGIVVP